MYSFTIDIGSLTTPVIGGGYISVSPFKYNAKLKKYRDEKYFKVVRLAIVGALIFKGEEYTALRELEKSNKIYVPIKCYYNGDLILTGRLNLFGRWDVNKTLCELDISTEDRYSEVFKNLDFEIDIKSALSATVKTNFNSIILTQESDCTTLTPGEMKTFMFEDDDYLWVWTSSYADNCTSPSVRHIYKTSFVRFPADGYTYSSTASGYIKPTTTSELIQTSFDRFRKMVDVTQKIFDLLSIPVTITESTFCDYFNDMDTEMKYLFIADKSDVKRRTSDTEASFEYIKVSDFFEIYKNISNLDWYINESLEFKLQFPESFVFPSFVTLPKHDFTANEYHVNLQRFSYDEEGRINKETWRFEDTQNPDFKQISITYDNLEENSKTLGNNLINMDFEYVATDSKDISDSGFVIVACEYDAPDYLIINKIGLVAPITQINAKLSTSHIINDHMLKADRPYPVGTFLGDEEQLITKNKKNVEYNNVPIFDHRELDFDYGIKTELGLMIPHEIEIDLELKKFSLVKGTVSQSDLPIVVTNDITSITSTTANVDCEVLTDKGFTVTERGIVYNQTGSPTTNDTKISSGTGVGAYTIGLTSLTSNSIYYVKAYAINENGTSYGDEIILQTLGTFATVRTDDATSIDALTATFNGELLSNGGSPVTILGFCYDVNSAPTILDSIVTVSPSVGVYSYDVTGLDYDTLYYVRSFATNPLGTSYGRGISFTTLGAEELWTVGVGTPIINSDEVTVNCFCSNDDQIELSFSIYLNGGWIKDSDTIPIGINRRVSFLNQNPLGTPIPTGTPYKVEVDYDSITYVIKSGTL